MSRKITQEDFLIRFQKRFPNANINIEQYSSIKSQCTIRCNMCNQVHTKTRAEGFLNSWPCCGGHDETKIDMVKRLC